MPHQSLEHALLPSGAFLLEFVDTAEPLDEASAQAQRELLRRNHSAENHSRPSRHKK